jgi:hypothetical protein
MEFGNKDQEVRNKFSASVLHHTAIIGYVFLSLSAVLLENWLMTYSRKNSGSAPITRNDRYGIKNAPGM